MLFARFHRRESPWAEFDLLEAISRSHCDAHLAEAPPRRPRRRRHGAWRWSARLASAALRAAARSRSKAASSPRAAAATDEPDEPAPPETERRAPPKTRRCASRLRADALASWLRRARSTAPPRSSRRRVSADALASWLRRARSTTAPRSRPTAPSRSPSLSERWRARLRDVARERIEPGVARSLQRIFDFAGLTLRVRARRAS